MEDIIDIIVTETTNTIEITSQPTDEIIDVNIIDNREDITLNVTPSLVEININSLTGNFGVEWGDITGDLEDQTDLQDALDAKADLVDGKVPSSQLPSYVDDIIEVANYASLPATGETGKIYVTLDTNKIYRWSGSAYIEIADSTAVWGAITGTLSSQTDLQNALNAKFDNPTGDTTQYIAGDGSLITFPVAGQAGTLVREVRNTTGSTITKGTIVYISGATGNKPTISKALATSDSTSAQTFGLAQANISNNSNGYVVCVGDLTGLDTSALSEGQQLYLSSTTAGAYTTTKQTAPAHLVYIGVVTRSHPTLGQIEVKIQNGYELDEIHDVAISSVANNQGIFWESSTSLWKNKSIATVLGYTPANDASVVHLAGTETITGAKTLTGGLTLGTASGDNQTLLNLPASTSLIYREGVGSLYGFNIESTVDNSLFLVGAESTYWQALYFGDSTGPNNIFGISTSGNAGSSWSARLVINQNGNVGLNKNNPSEILDVAGNGLFSGSLTANSIIKSGGTSSQFLKADGSIDSSTYLTTSSASSTYLPLTGGTLTGTLNGTNITITNSLIAKGGTFNGGASYGGIVTIDGLGSDLLMNRANTSNGSGITLLTNAVEKWNIGLRSAGTTDNFFIYNSNLTANSLTISSANNAVTLAGALSGTSASFSSTLSAAQSTFTHADTPIKLNNSGGTFTQLDFQNNGTQKGAIWWNNSTNTLNLYTGVTALTLTSSGNAGVGTAAPQDFGGSFKTMEVQGSTGGYILATNASAATIAQMGVGSGIAYYGLRTSGDVVFTTGNSERMRITSSGNVGIGTTSPGTGSLAKLEVSQSTSTGAAARFITASSKTSTTQEYPLYITTSDAWASNPFGFEFGLKGNATSSLRSAYIQTVTVNSSNDGNLLLQPKGGNVGIGTSSPATPLEVNGVIRSSKNEIGFQTLGLASKLEVYSASYENIVAFRSIPGDGINPYLLINTSSSGITLEENGSSYGALMFKTGAAERIRLTSGGDFGIGTTIPNYGGWGKAISILSSNSGIELAANASSNGASIGGLDFINTSNTTNKEVAQIASGVEGSTSGNSGAFIRFYTKPDAGSITERMRIKANGIINLSNVPSSATGLSSGDIYKTVAGILMIV